MATIELPDWIRKKSFVGIQDMRQILKKHRVSTVCEKARCPNIGECYPRPAATFLILGSRCTRNCGFCSVESSKPESLDPEEAKRVALAAKEIGLKYVIITSVTRDDLPDGGATQFAKTIRAIRDSIPYVKIEVLTPDFKGNIDSLRTVMDSRPDVYGHNIETVPRLYPFVRAQADYIRSLNLLAYAKKIAPDIYTKSGLMLGLGETLNEVVTVLRDLRNEGCNFITIGQYLRPSKLHLPVVEYIRPEVFEDLRKIAMDMGFTYAASSPLVRSSFNAEFSFAYEA